MKLSRLLCLASVPLLLTACSSVKLAATDAPGVVLASEEIRKCGHGRVVFPAGEYKAEVVSASGTYYKAPKRIRTLDVLIGRSDEGGIYVSNAAGNPQSAWFGNPKDNLGESPDTLLGAIGWSAPKLWPYTPRIPLQAKSEAAPSAQ